MEQNQTARNRQVRRATSGHGRVWIAAWLAATASIACGSGPKEPPPAQPPEGPDDTPGEPPDNRWGCKPAAEQPIEVDCARVAHIGLAESAPRLNSGIELSVRLEDEHGEPLDAGEYGRCLHALHPTDCSAMSQVDVAERPADGALIALLVAPGSSAESAAQARAVVEELLQARPAGERIGIYRWGESVRQVSNFSTDRAVSARLAKRGLVEDVEQPLLPLEALDGLRSELTALSQGAFAGVRSIVVVAPELSLDALPPRPAEIVEIWGVSRAAAASGPNVVALEESPAAAAGALSQSISRYVDAGLARLSFCGSGQPETILIQPQASPAELLVDTPEPLPEEGHMQCSLEALRQARAYPERIEFVFTNITQENAYYERIETRSKESFDVMVRLWQDGPLVQSKARLRGMSSLECQRKNFALNLGGSEARRLMPGSASDEFFLVSMCEDDRYLNHHTAFTLLSRLGLFPLKFRYVELVIDDEHKGVYMLVERPKDEIRKDNVYVRGIVRRNADLEGEAPEGKYGHVNKQQALDDYLAFMSAVEEAPPGQVLATLESRMDIDQYMRWIALMGLLGNGDYSDEAYFVSTETIDASLEPSDLYRMVAWDPENLFQPCHHMGQYAIVDPHGMLYCTESQLDHTMFADTEVYARYVSVLESVMAEVTQEVFESALDETVALLDSHFQKDEVREAMVEIIAGNPDAATYEGMMEDVNQGAMEMKTKFTTSQAQLREAIERWRGTQP